jgi:hypothetical protein
MHFVPLNVIKRHSVGADKIGSAPAAVIFAEARNEPAVVAEIVDAIREVGWRAAEDFVAGKDVPEKFSEGDDGFGH